MMINKKLLAQILAAVLGVFLLGGLGMYWPTLVGANATQATLGPLATIGDAISYQGYLTDENGVALNGTFTMRFQIYNAQQGGTLLWDSGNTQVSVAKGLFETRLEITNDIFNGEELWLAQTVGGELLTPRQEFLPAPLAHTLRPGAIVKGTASGISNNYAVEVHLNNDTFSFNRGAIAAQTTTGNAIYGLANNGRAVYGQTQDGYAIYGFDGGSLANRGFAGYFYSTNGIGVYGYSGANRSHPNIFAPGVYGQSNQGVGVYGRGDTSGSFSFYDEGGRFEGGDGVRGTGTDNFGYGGVFYGNYRGIYARSTNNTSYDGYFGGTGGINVHHIITRASGSVIMVNTGSEPIAPGDLVAMVGITDSPLSGEPILAVAKVNAANSKGVIGVASSAVALVTVPEENGGEHIEVNETAGSALPNQMVAVITEGLAPAVNIDTLPAALNWEIGDKIAVGGGGEITLALGAALPEAVVVGKVAGPIDEAAGTVPLYIDID